MKLPSNTQIKRVLSLIKEEGISYGRIDIMTNGVAIYPPEESGMERSAYDDWKKDQDSDRPAHR